MEENKYLPIGSSIAKKYEVVDVLGEDEFEILYLVRDVNRKGSFFVLKELFLETFSSREGELVFTIPEALGVFHKRKKQIIEEIKTQKSNSIKSEIKIYGYEDENNTIYTIMEFSNNASLEKYLQFTPKDVKSLPTLDALLNKKKSFNYSLILKTLLFLGLILGIAFYGYSFFQKKSLEHDDYELKKPVSENFPKLKERIKKVKKPTVQTHIPIVKEDTVLKEENSTEVVVTKVIKEPMVTAPNVEEIITSKEENKSSGDKEIVLEVAEVAMDTSLKEQVSVEEENVIEENATIPIENILKEFLDAYITTSATSAEDTLKFYDKKVKKYFRFNHPSHKSILKSQKRYNKKWVDRAFEISDFQIVKTYQKNGVNYYDLTTTTVWNVRNKRGKKLSGKSRGYMTLKEVGDSFKITSIYTIK